MAGSSVCSKTVQMSKVLKIYSTVCELLRTVDTDVPYFSIDNARVIYTKKV